MSEAGKVWYWRPGGIPIAATAKKIPDGVTAYCYEHGTEWFPIEQKPVQEKPVKAKASNQFKESA